MRTALLLSAVFATWSIAAQTPSPSPQKPPQPFVEEGLCPGEGCAFGRWTAMGTVLAIAKPPGMPFDPIAPGTEKPVFVVNPGEVITALTGTYVTLVPGRARVDKPVRVATWASATRVYDPTPEPRAGGEMNLSIGDVVYTYSTAEGSHTAWFNGRWFIFEEVTHGLIIERPSYVWWVKIRNARGQVGWTDQWGQFEGIDVLGGPYPETYVFYRTWRGFGRQPWTEISPGVRSKSMVGATSTFTITQLDPGAMTVPQHHSAAQISLSLDSTLEMRVGTFGLALGPRVGMAVPGNAEHSIANRGTAPATLLELEQVRRFDLLPPRPAVAFPIGTKPATVSAKELERVDLSRQSTSRSTPVAKGVRSHTWRGLTMFEVMPDAEGLVMLRSAPASAEQFYYCISGEVLLVSGAQEAGISPGELLLVPRSTAPLHLNVARAPKRPAAGARFIRFDPSALRK